MLTFKRYVIFDMRIVILGCMSIRQKAGARLCSKEEGPWIHCINKNKEIQWGHTMYPCVPPISPCVTLYEYEKTDLLEISVIQDFQLQTSQPTSWCFLRNFLNKTYRLRKHGISKLRTLRQEYTQKQRFFLHWELCIHFFQSDLCSALVTIQPY